MRTIEKLFGAIVLNGLLFLILNFPGGAILLIFSLSVLSFLYFPLGFYILRDKDTKQQNLGLSILSGLALGQVATGIMFSLLDFPGQEIMLPIGLVAILITLIAVFLLKRKATEELKTYYRNLLIRVAVWSMLAVVAFLRQVQSFLWM